MVGVQPGAQGEGSQVELMSIHPEPGGANWPVQVEKLVFKVDSLA